MIALPRLNERGLKSGVILAGTSAGNRQTPESNAEARLPAVAYIVQ